jgi:hypothetical protein
MSSLVARIILISDHVRELEIDTLEAGIKRTFAIARSHYAESINLEVMSQGYALGYEDEELDKMENDVAPLLQDLANKIADAVLP